MAILATARKQEPCRHRHPEEDNRTGLLLEELEEGLPLLVPIITKETRSKKTVTEVLHKSDEAQPWDHSREICHPTTRRG